MPRRSLPPQAWILPWLLITAILGQPRPLGAADRGRGGPQPDPGRQEPGADESRPESLAGRIRVRLDFQPFLSTLDDLRKFTVENSSDRSVEAVAEASASDSATGASAGGVTESFTVPPGGRTFTPSDMPRWRQTLIPPELEMLKRTGLFPQGRWNVCVRLRLSGHAEEIASDCQAQSVELPEIKLLSPPPDARPDASQDISFQWLMAGPAQWTYAVKIAEIKGQTPQEAMLGRPAIEEKDIAAQNFLYPGRGSRLVPGKAYAWQVSALVNQYPVAQSEIRTFTPILLQDKKDPWEAKRQKIKEALKQIKENQVLFGNNLDKALKEWDGDISKLVQEGNTVRIDKITIRIQKPKAEEGEAGGQTYPPEGGPEGGIIVDINPASLEPKWKLKIALFHELSHVGQYRGAAGGAEGGCGWFVPDKGSKSGWRTAGGSIKPQLEAIQDVVAHSQTIAFKRKLLDEFKEKKDSEAIQKIIEKECEILKKYLAKVDVKKLKGNADWWKAYGEQTGARLLEALQNAKDCFSEKEYKAWEEHIRSGFGIR